MTPAEKLKAAELRWLDTSQEEEFYFASFENPTLLRRSKVVPGALAALTFGKYEALDNTWIIDTRAIWLGMIVSDIPQQGGRLLDFLVKEFARLELFLIGTPTAMKPKGWDSNRNFSFRPETLICWYLKHNFRVVQSGSETRVIHPPKSSSFDASFLLK